MSTPESEEAQGLTRDEQILHHYAAMIKKDLEAHRENPQGRDNWNSVFANRLVCLIYPIHFHIPFSDYPERLYEFLSQFQGKKPKPSHSHSSTVIEPLRNNE